MRDHEEPTSAFVILLSRASKKAPPFAPPFVHALLFTPGWCASSAPGAEPEAFGGVLRLSLLGAPVARRAPRLGPYRLLDRFWTVGRSSRGRRGRVSTERGGTAARPDRRGAAEHTYYCLLYHANLSQAPPTVEVSAHAVVHGSDRSRRQKRQNQRQSTEHRGTSTKPEHEST